MSYRAPQRIRRRIKATELTWSDPGSRFNGGNPAENGGGTAFTVGIKGSLVDASLVNPDFDAACYGMMPLPDYWGAQVGATVESDWLTQLMVRFGTAPSVNDNVYIGCGIVNESSITGSTVDGSQMIIDFSAANTNPRVRTFTISNGTVGNAANGNATAGIAEGAVTCFRTGVAGVDRLGTIFGYDSSRTLVSGSGVASASSVVGGTGGRWLFVGFDRTLVADTDNISFDCILEISRMVTYAS